MFVAYPYLGCIRKQHRHQSEVQAALLDELMLDLLLTEKEGILGLYPMNLKSALFHNTGLKWLISKHLSN